MKYLFFDIECANCYDKCGKIYSFGYVIADEYLKNVELQEDVLINPKVDKWDPHVLKNILAYRKRDVENQKSFEEKYKRLKKLLQNKEIVICGFSVRDDVGYLLDECKRYGLEPFGVKAYDIQRLDSKILGQKTRGLETAYISLTGRKPEQAHKSDMDAFYTYEVAKELCKKTKKTLAELLFGDETFCCITQGFGYGLSDEPIETREQRRERKEAEKTERYAKHKKGLRTLKEGYNDFILRGSKNNILFLRLLDILVPNDDPRSIFFEKKVSISINYEMYNFRNMMKIITLISAKGGTYVKKATDADVFVRYHLIEDENERKCSKYEYVKSAIENGKDIKILEFEEFLALLGLTEKTLDETEEGDYEYLMDEKYKKAS